MNDWSSESLSQLGILYDNESASTRALVFNQFKLNHESVAAALHRASEETKQLNDNIVSPIHTCDGV